MITNNHNLIRPLPETLLVLEHTFFCVYQLFVLQQDHLKELILWARFLCKVNLKAHKQSIIYHYSRRLLLTYFELNKGDFQPKKVHTRLIIYYIYLRI